MRLNALVLVLLLGSGLAGCAGTGGTEMLATDAPRALPATGPVAVAWEDPATFSELKTSGNRMEAARGNWLQDLASHLRKSAGKYLPPGNTLDVTIVDLQRAGRYEPWQGIDRQHVRMIRDIYPPRMTVRFRQLDATGQPVAEGERKLTDPAFMTGAAPLSDSDPLRYEKRMINAWLRREFGTQAAAR